MALADAPRGDREDDRTRSGQQVERAARDAPALHGKPTTKLTEPDADRAPLVTSTVTVQVPAVPTGRATDPTPDAPGTATADPSTVADHAHVAPGDPPASAAVTVATLPGVYDGASEVTEVIATASGSTAVIASGGAVAVPPGPVIVSDSSRLTLPARAASW